LDEHRLRRLVDVGRSLVTELDPEAVFARLLEVARELTGARYAAIGVLDERREQLERFLTAGIDEDTHRAIGDLPRGRGVLGALISDPRPLRLADVGMHAQSYGFPLAHPPMTTFLGVPLMIDGQAWGNLYLTEKAGGEFTDHDEEAAVVLADWAAIAIANARLYRTVRERKRARAHHARARDDDRDQPGARRRDQPRSRTRTGRQALARVDRRPFGGDRAPRRRRLRGRRGRRRGHRRAQRDADPDR